MLSITALSLCITLIISGLIFGLLLLEFLWASVGQIKRDRKNGLAWGYIILLSSLICWIVEIIFNMILIGGNVAFGPRGIFWLSPLTTSPHGLITLAWILLAFLGGITGMIVLRTNGKKTDGKKRT